MADFDLSGAFQHLHDRFDRIEDNVQEVRDMTVKSSAKLEGLVGNGQPGAIDKIHTRLTGLEEYKNKAIGYIGGISLVGTGLGFAAHFIMDWMRGPKH